MGRPGRQTCIRCGGHVDEVGSLSSRYRCGACGIGAAIENMDQLHAHAGHRFDHWRRRTLAAFGITLPEPKGNPSD